MHFLKIWSLEDFETHQPAKMNKLVSGINLSAFQAEHFIVKND